MEITTMSVKDCIKSARYKLGMSQIEFSVFLGINKASISQYERGMKQPGFKSIRLIVDKLKEKGIYLAYSDLRLDGKDIQQ